MDERLRQMCEQTAGVRVYHNDNGWQVQTLESDLTNVREWGTAPNYEDALAYCYGGFIGKTDVKVREAEAIAVREVVRP